ncbi:MAG: ABC transporter substrate-binding protein [Bermanella sp.]
MFNKWLCITIVTLLSASLWAEVTVIGTDIPGLHQKDGKGVYDMIINETLLSKGLATLTVLPPARAEAQFESCQNCCFSPANKNPDFYDFGGDVMVSDPMNVAKVYIFSAPGKKAFASYANLKGKKTGVRRGMNFGKSFVAANLKASEANNLEQNIKKLENGRIDAMVAYVPDAYLAFSGMGKGEFPHAKNQPVAVHNDALVCRGVPADFIGKFNGNLKKLSDSGKLKSILGDSYVAP